MSATTWPGLISSARMARLGASSASRSGRSSQPAPAAPITGAITRPLTGWRVCASSAATSSARARAKTTAPLTGRGRAGRIGTTSAQLSSLRGDQDASRLPRVDASAARSRIEWADVHGADRSLCRPPPDARRRGAGGGGSLRRRGLAPRPRRWPRASRSASCASRGPRSSARPARRSTATRSTPRRPATSIGCGARRRWSSNRRRASTSTASTWAGHVQTGVAACFSVDEYARDLIKKHEKTRPDKEDDRTRHILALRAQTGPVFLTYRASPEVDAVVAGVAAQPPLFDFTAADGVRHEVWVRARGRRPGARPGLRGDPRALHRRWPPSRGQRLPHAPGAERRGARRTRPVPRRRLPRLPDAGAALPPRRARPQRPHAGGLPGRPGRAVHGEPGRRGGPGAQGPDRDVPRRRLVDASISARRPPPPGPTPSST